MKSVTEVKQRKPARLAMAMVSAFSSINTAVGSLGSSCMPLGQAGEVWTIINYRG
ncbi:MAG: hypothetical protein JNK77_03175 [Saprospiraceae bacterium]|nr:hypothetical protein [Saprospiraceae bacterium]